MGGNGNWSPETDDFILRNVLYLLYGADKTKGNKAYKSPGILKNPQKTDCFKRIDNYQDFFNLHFAGYLAEVKKGASYLICDVETGFYSDMSLLTKTRRDLLAGIKNYSGKGSKVRKALMDKIEALSSNKSGLQHYVDGINYEAEFSQVIDEIEYANYCILKAWDLNLGETVAKLNVFMERMEAGESKENTKLIPFPSEMRTEIFTLIRTQITKAENASDPWESVATVITWLLLLSLFRGEAGKIAAYYGKMGEQHVTNCNKERIAEFVKHQMSITPSVDKLTDKSMDESTSGLCSDTHKKTDSPRIRISRYAPPTEIRPFTMEEVGNLRNTYVERTDILPILDQIFWGDSQNEKRYVFLSGMGGDGKSELARAYAYHHQMDYDDIFWLTCQDGKTPELDQLLKDNSYTINPNDRKILNSHTMLIIDNCNEIPAPFLRQLCYETGQAHLLITTRLKEISVENKHILPVFADEGQILLPGNFGFSYSNFDHPEISVHAEASVQAEENTQTEKAVQAKEITQTEKIAQAKKNIMTQEDFAYQIFYRNYFANFPDAKEIEKQLIHSERENIRKICRRMGNHPMITAMVAVMLRENQDDYSIEEFEENSRRNLSEAIPSYLSIPFGQNGKDCEEEPLELLRKLFVSSSMREFSLYEKQLLNLLQLVPARQMNIPYICELLGDTKFNRAIKNAYDKLQRLHLIQSNGTWMSIHPLVSEALKLEPEKIQLENRELFFQKVLESWLSGDLQNFDDCLMYYVWNQSGIKEEKSNFNLAVCSVLQKEDAKVLFTQLNPEVNMAFTAFVDSENTRTFLYYDLEQRKEIIFYNLGKRQTRKRTRKGNEGYQGNIQNITQTEIQNVVLLYLVWGDITGDLEFPDEIFGCSITEIPDAFCRQRENITGLCLPAGLERIGNYAFEGCFNIHSELKLPESLKEIGIAAFFNCTCIYGDLVIPDNIIKIQKKAFSNCGLNGNLFIGKNLEEIDDSVFYKCNFKGTVEFNEKIWRIGNYAFEENITLENIILKEGLEIIGDKAFYSCWRIKNKLYLPTTLKKIGRSAFEQCINLSGKLSIPEKLDFLGSSAFAGCKNLSGNVIIPPNIKTIKNNTFSGCIKIRTFAFHSNIRIIEENAFMCCYGLNQDIILPDMLESLGAAAFQSCTALKTVIFNPKIRRIEESTFANCEQLQYIKLPEHLELIDTDAFNKCYSLKQISSFPDELKEIGNNAFSECTNLEMNITFPSQLQKIGKGAFFKCSHLTGDLKLPPKLKTISEKTFAFCTGLDGKIFFPNKLESIEEEAFRECTNLKGNLDFPSSLKKIGDSAFKKCTQLEGSLIFHEGLTSIGDETFSECINLSGKLYFPKSLCSIYNTAFQGCEKLAEQNNIFNLIKSVLYKINIRDQPVIENEMTILKRSWVQKILPYSSKDFITPQGVIKLDDESFCDSQIHSILFSTNLTEIGRKAFGRCYRLTSISKFPTSLKKIHNEAFFECANLKIPLQLPDSLEEIGSRAFFSCCELYGKIIFPQKITQINEGTFIDCRNLEELIFSPGIKKIKNSAFYNCHGIYKIQFAEGIQEIDSLAFYNCKKLEKIVFPTGLKRIGVEAFSNCHGLENITFSEGLEVIEKGSFLNTALEKIEKLPSTLRELHNDAFGKCYDLTGDLLIPKNTTFIGNRVFENSHFSNIIVKNPFTLIGNRAFGHISAVIWGHWNSTAHDYAKKYGHKFCDIRDWPDC